MPMHLIKVFSASTPEANLVDLAIEALEPFPRGDRYRALVEFFNTAIRFRQRLVDSVTIRWEYFMDNSIWDNEFPTLERFEATFSFPGEVKAMVQEGTQACRRTLEYLDDVAES